MGKRDVANRTKGNAKPSSSARSASVLAAASSSATAPGGFVSFSDVSTSALLESAAFVPATEDALSSSLTPEMRACMRKMAKKDATTKIKALQEFVELVDRSSEECTVTALPYWPRIFCRLSNDLDRRVRENAHRAHLAVTRRSRRSLAPHLRSLFGAWLLGQHDPHAPAASIARNAFEEAFPTRAKERDAMLYCQVEVMQVMEENLLTLTPQNLADADTSSSGEDLATELESKYERVIVATLQAYGSFLAKTEQMSFEKMGEVHTKILSDQKFWKFATHKVIPIRRAWYSMITAVAEHFPSEIFEKYQAKLCSCVFGHLDERDALLLLAVWDAALTISKKCEKWTEHVNIQKAVKPKLLLVLRKGAFGNGADIYPKVLPLLGQFPASELSSPALYDDVLAALREGLVGGDGVVAAEQPRAYGGRVADVRNGVTAVFECLRFGLTKCAKSAQDSNANENLFKHAYGWLEESFLNPSLSKVARETVFSQYAALLRHLSQQEEKCPVESGSSLFDPLWTETSRIVLQYQKLLGEELVNVAEFISVVRCGSVQGETSATETRKKKKGICFDQDEKEDSSQHLFTQSKQQQTNEIPLSLNNKINELALRLCVVTMENIADKEMKRCEIELFGKLCRAFGSQEFYASLVGEARLNPGEQHVARVLLDQVVLLQKRSSQTIPLAVLAELAVTILMTGLEGVADREALLSDITENVEIEWLEAIFNALTKSHSRDCLSKEGMRHWMNGDNFGKRILHMAKELAQEALNRSSKISNKNSSWNLLRMVFAQGDLADSTMDRILSEFTSVLLSVNSRLSADATSVAACQVIGFVCDLVEILSENSSVAPPSNDILVALFMLDCNRSSAALPPDTQCKLRHSWIQSLRQLLDESDQSEGCGSFCQKAATCIKEGVLSASCVDELGRYAEIASQMIKVLQEASDLEKHQAEALLAQMLPTETEWRELRAASLPSEKAQLLLLGKLHHFTLSREESAKVKTGVEEVFVHLKAAAFLCLVMRNVFMAETKESEENPLAGGEQPDEEEEICSAPAPAPIAPVADSTSRALLICSDSVILDAVVQTLASAAFAKHALLGSATMAAVLNTNSEMLLSMLTQESKEGVVRRMAEASKRCGYSWTLALGDILTILKKSNSEIGADVLEAKNIVSALNQDYTESLVQTVMAIIPMSSANLALHVLSQESARLDHADLEDDGARAVASLSLMAQCLRFLDDHNDDDGERKKVVEGAARAAVTWISEQKQKNEQRFLFARTLSAADWQDVSFVCASARLLEATVSLKSVPDLDGALWDMLLCSVTSWVQTIEENIADLEEDHLPVQLFSTAIASLIASVSTLMSEAAAGKRDSQNLPANIVSEWKEFFCDGIFSVLLASFVRMASSSRTTIETSKCFLRSLGAAVVCISDEQLFEHELPAKFLADDVDCDAAFPDKLLFLLNHLAPMLASDQRAIQLTAFHLLYRVMEKLVTSEETSAEKSPSSGDDECRELPRRLSELLAKTHPVLMSLFEDLEFGDAVHLPPASVAYNVAATYLLTWKLILALVSKASPELRPRYSEHMRRSDHMGVLLALVFHIVGTVAPPATATAFLSSDPKLVPEVEGNLVEELQHLACSVFHGLLKHLPALVRHWWGNADKKSADIVEKFTKSYATPVLWTEEAENINTSKLTFDNMTIKVRSSVREVVALYTVDDGSMELVIQLPANFPLGAVKVESGRRVGVGTAQWRNWMLQLTTFLQHQNGSILDGLVVWKRNVDKRFEGVEECYICFYILHGSNHQLPKLACRTCKKKFHSACLYKWFSTSNNSTCPLCRNLF